MNKKAEDIYQKALSLSEEERERLALLLHNTLADGFASPPIERAWMDECDRREAAVERGEMELIPAEEVHRGVSKQLQK
jgi:hypothetical protein